MPGRILKIDFHQNLCFIQVDKNPGHLIHLFISKNMMGINEKLYSVNCPTNLDKAVCPGSIIATKHLEDFILWQIQMKIYPANSESPVFDVQGNWGELWQEDIAEPIQWSFYFRLRYL